MPLHKNLGPLLATISLVLGTACGPSSSPGGPATVEACAETGCGSDAIDGADSTDHVTETGDTAGEDRPAPVNVAPFELTQTPRNLLVISIDTLRKDRVGAYGGGDDTPFLDELAERGVRFARHHAGSSWTYPGSTCALTGTTPTELGYFPNVSDDDLIEPLASSTPTLASTLQAEGYQTALFSSNSIIGTGTGLATGYDVADVMNGYPAEVMTSAALDHVDLAIDPTAPWMLHVHYIDPHAPYAPPEEYLDGLADLEPISWDLSTLEGTWEAVGAYKTLSEEEQENLMAHITVRYEGEVRYADDAIAELMSQLDARGMLDDTLVLVWTDHGEQLAEHGGIGHGGSLYGEDSDGVALFWSRDLVPAVWPQPTAQKDLAPTTLRLLGFDVPEGMSGIFVSDAEDDRPVFDTLIPKDGVPLQTVTVGDAKLIYSWSGTKRLFLRDTDPDEKVDVYDPESNQVQLLWDQLLPRVIELQGIV